jgi:hypothetical protein
MANTLAEHRLECKLHLPRGQRISLRRRLTTAQDDRELSSGRESRLLRRNRELEYPLPQLNAAARHDPQSFNATAWVSRTIPGKGLNI